MLPSVAGRAARLRASACGVESSVDEAAPPIGLWLSEEDEKDVFVVDLEKGGRGLGLGLIDGLVSTCD